ncbi:hypothetical protein [Deinococcus aquiradiocola]|uniref:Uncharacterized protein n=1 Tax=Deinococcus aquiradiocola TaxID=393059 RepID=A0A917UQE2_9DEIO|nr:hypothetical protein [Deinococcus aquiradiocola]GGJ75508.1 hypothetical protein GCM10008939_19690 [Deinococcus aquiradiocola]
MNINVTRWTVTRKKIRPSFNLGALGMLFSVSDRVSGPSLNDRDRRDVAYPYRLALDAAARPGRYRLDPSGPAARAWAEALGTREWRTEAGKGGPALVTDLTEYERLQWEELAAGRALTLTFQPLD